MRPIGNLDRREMSQWLDNRAEPSASACRSAARGATILHHPASAAIVTILRPPKMYGMAQAAALKSDDEL
jgi:hypothetical protein